MRKSEQAAHQQRAPLGCLEVSHYDFSNILFLLHQVQGAAAFAVTMFHVCTTANEGGCQRQMAPLHCGVQRCRTFVIGSIGVRSVLNLCPSSPRPNENKRGLAV